MVHPRQQLDVEVANVSEKIYRLDWNSLLLNRSDKIQSIIQKYINVR